MINFSIKVVRRCACLLRRGAFASCGPGLIFNPLNSEFSYDRIRIGKKVYIGAMAYFRTTHSHITIGDNVLFGPGVYILGGNHIYDVPGIYMSEMTKSSEHKDADVTVGNDVWIGARATLLSGVTVHDGAIVASGCVVTSDIPAFEIHGGVPNRKISDRFTSEQLAEHRKMLLQRHE